jgi:glucose-6-phosphate 1-epimerase
MTIAIPEFVTLDAGKGGLPRVRVRNALGAAEIYLDGGHVTSFIPAGGSDLLWMSAQSLFAEGKPIRGGIPLCWPWFGPDPKGLGRAGHGVARLARWTPVSAAQLHDGRTRIDLALDPCPATAPGIDQPFHLDLTVIVGRELDVRLTTVNTGRSALTIDDALHTYFAVHNVRSTTITGLDGIGYVDKVDGGARKVQVGAIAFTGETDRVYLPTTGTTVIDDGARRIRVAKSGSAATVVWNPWTAKAKAMADFGDDEWTGMLCIEAANCLDAPIHLLPGTAHTTTQVIGLV